MLAVTGACMLTFTLSRRVLRGLFLQHFSARIRNIDRFIRDHTFSVTLLFRLLPVGSNWMVNIAAGASDVRSLPFFLGSVLGYVPQMLVFALVGSGSRLGQFWQVGLSSPKGHLFRRSLAYSHRSEHSSQRGSPLCKSRQ